VIQHHRDFSEIAERLQENVKKGKGPE